MPDIFFDFGNADVKFFDGHRGMGYFRHAIAQITESQWKNVVQRAKQPPEGYIAIDGHYFVVGDKARRYTLRQKPKGAARYSSDYYGVAMCYAIAELYPSKTNIINLFASHAPRDIEYRENIIKSTIGKWQFITHRGEYNLTVRTVDTCDEPICGFFHLGATKDGKMLKSNPYKDKTALVVDIGGYTCDAAIIDAGGMIDEASLSSTLTGTIGALSFYETELRSRYSDLFRGVGDINEERLEKAMLEGFYQYGNQRLDSKDISDQAIQSLVNDVRDMILASGGVANFDVILLTGGGSALIYDKLIEDEKNIDFVMVEKSRELMRYANVFGSSKLFKFLSRIGA